MARHVLHHAARDARTRRRVALLDDVVPVGRVARAEKVGLSTVGDRRLGVPVVGQGWG